MINKITINGETYVKEKTTEDLKWNIMILQRGWCMVGRLKREGSDCELYDASVIRVWGTTRGLGQIAEDGPTNETILDKCYGIVRFDNLTVVASIECNQDKWK